MAFFSSAKVVRFKMENISWLKWLLLFMVLYVSYMFLSSHLSLSANPTFVQHSSVKSFYSIKDIVKKMMSTKDDTYYQDETVYKEKARSKSKFSDVRTFLLFIGYPRTGSTLIGSLLDAHPNIIIANEYDLFLKWKTFTEDQKTKEFIYNQLWEDSITEFNEDQRSKNTSTFFDYHVPGAWQGPLSDTIKIIGDKKAKMTTTYLSSRDGPRYYLELKNIVNIPIKFVHVVRNPFDTVSTMMLRSYGLRTKVKNLNEQINDTMILYRTIENYLRLVDQNVKLRQIHGENVLDIHYSSFLRQPKVWLMKMCDFLEVYCNQDYLENCVKIIYPKETYTRRYVAWPEEYKQRMMNKINEVSFLKGHSFDFT